ncbi:Aminopeptidase-like protein, partial [Operophtera brumata]
MISSKEVTFIIEEMLTSSDVTKMTLSTSRQQFLAYETQPPENIQYGRKGGVFISNCVCVGFVLFAILLALIVGYSSQTNVAFWDETEPFGQSSQPAADLRLPSDVVPSFYRLKLRTDLDNASFTGEVAITLRASKQVKKIILHSKNLTISQDAKLTELIYERVAMLRTKRDAETGNTTKTAENPSNVTETVESAAIVTETVESAGNVTETVEGASNVTETVEGASNGTETVGGASNVTETVQNATEASITPVQPVDTQVTHSNAKRVKILTIMESTGDRLVIVLASALKSNVDYILELSFSGKIGDSLTGFYKSTYTNKDKES